MKTYSDFYSRRHVYVNFVTLLSVILIYLFILEWQKYRLQVSDASFSVPPTPYSPDFEISEDPEKTEYGAKGEDVSVATTSPMQSIATPVTVKTGTELWRFNGDRDEKNYGLSAEQCEAAFQDHYIEIDRAVEYRKSIGNITSQDLDISWKKGAGIRAMILDQQLYILEAKMSGSSHDKTRGLATLQAIHRAILTSPNPVPDIEFSFTTSDVADPDNTRHSIWALSRLAEEEEKWLMPDFGYWSWPNNMIGGYEQVRREIAELETDFSQKEPQLFWRGAAHTNPLRQDLLKVTAGKEWADVEDMVWTNASVADQSSNAKTIAEHCRYQFLVQTEGRTYSGRGKYLLNCDSVVIMHKRKWIEPHHSLLIASGHDQNFVEVQNDFSDLEEKILPLLERPELARVIAHNGVKTFRDRYLTPAAQACYWRRLFDSWAQVSPEPEAWEFDEESGEKRIRGVPFETFVLSQTVLEPTCSWLSRFLGRC